jgi:hypothetical protein
LGVSKTVPDHMHGFAPCFGSFFCGHSSKETHLDERDQKRILAGKLVECLVDQQQITISDGRGHLII